MNPYQPPDDESQLDRIERRFELHHGDCLDVLKTLADCSVDAIVTDPPYGLSFMGKRWDYDVPTEAVWVECLRVLKPGGHLLAFAGTRTQHRMAVRIEDAGFEIRDMIAWVYGCLSEDTEVLTESGWMLYNKAKQERILAYDVQTDVYKWEKPSRWNEYRIESDTAYRIHSNHTDQIVSRGHRCLVERNGKIAFVQAEELSRMEHMPYLQNDFFALPQRHGELLLEDLLRQSEGLAKAIFSKRQREKEAGQGSCWRKEPCLERGRDLLQAQREIRGSVDQVCSVPCEHEKHGEKGRVCYGAQASSCNCDRQGADTDGVRASYQSRRNGQQTGKPDAVCYKCGSQAIRARASYQTTLATVTPIEYSGLIWCPTVSTGAFVARRNGKIFITGNSGFPKSLDVSKAIDKAAGAEREVVGVNPNFCENRVDSIGTSNGIYGGAGPDRGKHITAPSTEAAKQWEGWGTAIKPSLEPITLARKPLIGTVAANVLEHGTGGLNIGACRVGDTVETWPATRSYGGGTEYAFTNTSKGVVNSQPTGKAPEGRWPANFIHDNSEEVLALFPETGPTGGSVLRSSSRQSEYGMDNCEREVYLDTGSAARFFYCAKASRDDRDEGCGAFEERGSNRYGEFRGTEDHSPKTQDHNKSRNPHPTVKPTDLMRYLCRLITPPGGIVLDPFTGSGSTGKAAMAEGFRFIGIEREAEYIEIARARISAEADKPRQLSLF
jgi:site-specific DNA-methyltransferase (adenine-specific)